MDNLKADGDNEILYPIFNYYLIRVDEVVDELGCTKDLEIGIVKKDDIQIYIDREVSYIEIHEGYEKKI